VTKNERFAIGFVVVAAGAGIAYFATRDRAPAPPPASSFNPVTTSSSAPSASTPRDSKLVASAVDAGVTPQELRNWKTRIDTELCSKAGERLNTLDGRAPTDPKAINTVSLCLQYGNVAWYKCLLEAKDVTEAKSCNVRFLGPAPP